MANIDPVDLLQEIADAGGDVWEGCVSAGIEANVMMDEGRWTLGDLACIIGVKKYGKNAVNSFAKSINMEVARVRGYRLTSGFYKKAIRIAFLEEYQNLTYSHFVVALRLENLKDALEFLRECNDGEWTVERARIILNKRLGKPTPPLKLLDADDVCILSVHKSRIELDVLGLNLEANDELMKALRQGKPIKLTIHEVRDEDGNITLAT